MTNTQNATPIEMLKEVEAYLTFRLFADSPNVPVDDMQAIKNDIAALLKKNGENVDYEPNKVEY